REMVDASARRLRRAPDHRRTTTADGLACRTPGRARHRPSALRPAHTTDKLPAPALLGAIDRSFLELVRGRGRPPGLERRHPADRAEPPRATRRSRTRCTLTLPLGGTTLDPFEVPGSTVRHRPRGPRSHRLVDERAVLPLPACDRPAGALLRLPL